MNYIWNKYVRRYELTQEEAMAFCDFLYKKTGCQNILELRIFRDGRTVIEIEGIEWGGYEEV